MESVDETLSRIWCDLLPHRKLSFEDEKITVSGGGTLAYPANEMSDGERVILYLLAQCLLVRDGMTVIIDEPELHVHRSLLSPL